MALPPFNQQGDLPIGVHLATLEEVVDRFGGGSRQRQKVTRDLETIYSLVRGAGKLYRFVIFGSYVTAKRDPNDVDIVMVMAEDFQLHLCDNQTRAVFDHEQVATVFGASLFWTRPSMIFRETLDEFLEGWQVKRDKSYRGIVEVIP